MRAAVRHAGTEFGLGWLAAHASTPPPEPIDESKVQPGVIGLVFFLASVVAVGLLGWSMIGRMKRLDGARMPGGWAAREPAVVPTSELTAEPTSEPTSEPLDDLPEDVEREVAGATSAADAPAPDAAPDRV